MKRLYGISVDGCDDYTYIEYELTDKEYELIKKIAEKILEKITEKNDYGCQPVIFIEEVAT